MKINSILNKTMATILVVGLLASNVNAQTKPAHKQTTSSSEKKEKPTQAPKKEDKKEIPNPKPAEKAKPLTGKNKR